MELAYRFCLIGWIKTGPLEQGNSNAQERIDLLTQFVDLFGKERILSLTCDREFIDH
ncbi:MULTISPECIES: hypothetical protein [unclassified Spirosoma]|uniref:hypothetical protein n=1 Tax=unclassified Spirosoma TaxID=2621999 RepID=UPI000AD4AAD5|nr:MULTISPECIES: hypothetical protein [unclassified Spirosoma]MBN8820498.1 hypothetical protein [Spirosoma sp.]